jgi:hypothetical protein
MDKIKIILLKIKPFFIIFFILIFISYLKSYVFDYFRVWPICRINLEQFYPDDKTNSKISQALSFMRKNNPEDYLYVCKNIDSIEAKFCDLKHLLSEEKDSWHKKDGCYVKGGRTIYLNPDYISRVSTFELEEKIKYLSNKKKSFDESIKK